MRQTLGLVSPCQEAQRKPASLLKTATRSSLQASVALSVQLQHRALLELRLDFLRQTCLPVLVANLTQPLMVAGLRRALVALDFRRLKPGRTMAQVLVQTESSGRAN